MDAICIIDFNGYTSPGHFPVSMSADWDGSKVVFGGEWYDVPDMPVANRPTEHDCLQWVEATLTGRTATT